MQKFNVGDEVYFYYHDDKNGFFIHELKIGHIVDIVKVQNKQGEELKYNIQQFGSYLCELIDYSMIYTEDGIIKKFFDKIKKSKSWEDVSNVIYDIYHGYYEYILNDTSIEYNIGEKVRYGIFGNTIEITSKHIGKDGIRYYTDGSEYALDTSKTIKDIETYKELVILYFLEYIKKLKDSRLDYIERKKKYEENTKKDKVMPFSSIILYGLFWIITCLLLVYILTIFFEKLL